MHNLIIALRALIVTQILYFYKNANANTKRGGSLFVAAAATTTTTLTSTSVVLTSTITADDEGATIVASTTDSASSAPRSFSDSVVVVTETTTATASRDDSEGFIGFVPTATTTSHSATFPSNTMGDYKGDALRDAVLESTNYHRTAHDAVPLTWNSTLAEYAAEYAENCKWEHSGGPYGENLASGYNTSTLAVEAWAAEEADYNYSRAKFGKSTGHFTQLVWNETTSMGCGAVNCDGDVEGWFLVCEYYPPGNVKGEFKANIAKGDEGEGQIGVGEEDDNDEDGEDGGESGAGSMAGGGAVRRLLAAALLVGVFLM